VTSAARRALPGALLLVALLAYAALVYFGLGPMPDGLVREWWQPRGFLRGSALLAPLGENVRLAIAVLWLPSAGLAAAAFAASRSALVRTLALGAAFACGLFLFYALRPPGPQIWAFFRWRGSAVMLSIALVAASSLAAPLLAASWLRLGWSARAATFAPALGGVALLQTHVTGTDPSLPFSVSPWPVLTVFGLGFVATPLAAAFALAAVALAGWRWRARRPLLAGAGIAAATGGGVAALRLEPTPDAVLAGAIALAALALAVASHAAGGRSAGARTAAGRAALAAVLVGLPLLAGRTWASLDYRETRDERAQRIIDALAAYYAREGGYPEDLRQLVAARDLDAVPRPRIGLEALAPQEFTYQNFGTDYLLEFAAPGWTQCAYSPPWSDETERDPLASDRGQDEAAAEAPLDEDVAPPVAEDEGAPIDDAEDADDEAIESLPGEWSCPSKPPDLW
jgi:hypothetical protein